MVRVAAEKKKLLAGGREILCHNQGNQPSFLRHPHPLSTFDRKMDKKIVFP